MPLAPDWLALVMTGAGGSPFPPFSVSMPGPILEWMELPRIWLARLVPLRPIPELRCPGKR